MKVRRPELVLAAAVAVCLPMVPGVLSGAISPMTGLLRLLIALVICWVGGGVLGNLLSRYSEEARKNQIVRMIERASAKGATDQQTNQQGRPSATT